MCCPIVENTQRNFFENLPSGFQDTNFYFQHEISKDCEVSHAVMLHKFRKNYIFWATGRFQSHSSGKGLTGTHTIVIRNTPLQSYVGQFEKLFRTYYSFYIQHTKTHENKHAKTVGGIVFALNVKTKRKRSHTILLLLLTGLKQA